MEFWRHPAFLAVAALGCVLVAGWLLRVGRPRREVDFSCDLCGRRLRGYSAREWRFCPYCGTPAKREKPLY